MKQEHTSGPWGSECALSSDMYNIRYITGPDGQKICDVSHRIEMSQTEALANARLIAAAPKMLQKLEHVVAWMSGYGTKTQNEMRDEVRSIIQEVIS